jgi:MFS family permease
MADGTGDARVVEVDAASATAPGRERMPREIWVLVATAFLVAIGYGLVAPTLPVFVRSFDVGITAASLVISVFALSRLLFAPVSGRLVSRLGELRTYLLGLGIVAVSTGACAFAAEYWQLLVFRSLGGIGSTMFFVSALGLMIRISPEDARGRVAGMFSTSFLLGSVGGPVLGAATVGLGLGAPFIIYGVALMIAAAVVFFSLRNSSLASPARETEPTVTVRVALRQRAYRAALMSNFAMGWSVFGLRMALVPLFVAEALDQGPGVAGLTLAVFALGNVSAVFPSGYLSDRVGRRTLLIVGLSVSAVATAVVGFSASLPLFLAGAYVAGAASGMFSSPQQAAVADIIGSKARAGTAVATFQMMADLGSILGSLVVGQVAQHTSFGWAFVVSGAILLVAAVGWTFAPETRGRPPAEHTPVRALGPEAGGEVP